MGYFSNGTEGGAYQSEYCFRCANRRNKKDGCGFGCAIWDLHLQYSYKLANSKADSKKMLDFLIPLDAKGCFNKECRMFLPSHSTQTEKNSEEGK